MSTYATVGQGLFATDLYSNLDGSDMREGGRHIDATGPFHVLSFRPWIIQVQEQDERGVWHMIYTSGEFLHKADAIDDANRQGIVLDHVGWQSDRVESLVLGRVH